MPGNLPQAQFVSAAVGQRFCIFHPAQAQSARGSVVYVHPLGDEMNKARRMAALQCRALSRIGFAVLQLDLLGCGDSSGDFKDATWEAWVQDVVLAADWLRTRSSGPYWLWGLRTGCLLASAAAARMPDITGLLFWQPTPDGKPVLNQFLRLRSAQGLQDGQNKGAMAQLRAELAAGKLVEVGGYAMPMGLAQGLESSKLLPPPAWTKTAWLEVSSREDPAFSPASASLLDAWRARGTPLHSEVVRGPAFWQTSEIEDAPDLIKATNNFMDQQAAA